MRDPRPLSIEQAASDRAGSVVSETPGSSGQSGSVGAPTSALNHSRAAFYNRLKSRLLDLSNAASPPTAAAQDEASEEPGNQAPTDPKTLFLAGLFVIAVVAVLYIAQAVILPIVLALVLKLLFQPVMRQTDRLHVPRIIAALLATTFLVAVLASIFAILSGSASHWFSQLPQGASRLEDKFSFLHAPADVLRQLNDAIDRVLSGNTRVVATEAQTQHLALPEVLLAGTGALLDTSLSTLVLLFFLLAIGDTFLRRLVEVLPRFRDKRQAVDISMQIERDIGSYLVTVTGMNIIVGLATTLGMYLCGLGDPILWGVIAFVLNYIPILGPIAGFALLGLVGFVSFDNLGAACIPAIIYIAIHVVEGEVLTPMLLARRFTLNPAVIVMSLIFWYWMWGVAGAFLAVPLLAISKVICERFRPLVAFGHFLGN